MKGKFLFVVGLGIGYVLGTRAGRERYEQIRKAAEDVWNQPKVQEGVQTVKDFAMSRAGDLGETVLDGAKKLVSQVTGSQTASTTTASTRSSSTTTSGSTASANGTRRASTSGASKPAGSRAKPSSTTKSGTSSSAGTSSS